MVLKRMSRRVPLPPEGSEWVLAPIKVWVWVFAPHCSGTELPLLND